MTIPANTRYSALNEVLAHARRAGSPPSVTEEQLLALQRRWAAALSARLDAAIEFAGQESLPEAAARAWRELAAEQDTLRGVLDAGQARVPALVDAQRAELRMLALAAGLATLDDPADWAVDRGRLVRGLTHSGVPTLPRVA
ncbi:MAG TPA: hypothetical protein VK735_08375 [Pseudonocardia sp.]|uniref:hypothetical protein n=1 Tax=Pseudonocardia sp. TaxID=60912 RepID=UPI002B7B6E20|nr:hypothetical protein [Pseudonocardia sp.]HTF47446.1 hypothetical protein [Pseudonocardia sp.]